MSREWGFMNTDFHEYCVGVLYIKIFFPSTQEKYNF